MKKSVLATLLAAVLPFAVHAANWSYSGDTGVATWGEHYPTCEFGENQSPINITKAYNTHLEPLNIHYQGDVAKIINNGHTIEAVVEGNNTLTLDGDVYTLKQFHFHTPSENHINGKTFPMEAHFVHQDAEGNLAVLAVMFQNGIRENDALGKITAHIPSNGKSVELKGSLSPADLLPPYYGTYYRFNGSLTTPPCSEGVRWVVVKDTQTASKDQISAMHSMMGKNARPVQDINARVVVGNR